MKKFYVFVLTIIFIMGVKHAIAKLKHIPPARVNHTAVYDPMGRQMIIFGGNGYGGQLSDTWVFDIEKRQWKEIETEEAPPERYGHTAVYDSDNKQMIIFGGAGKGGVLSDTWILDVEKKKWEEIETDETPAEPRYNHSAIYDSASKQMIVFGGSSNKGVLSDIWAFDVKNKKWKEIEVEDSPAKTCHSAMYDPKAKKMVVFGGSDNMVQYFSDIWILNIERERWEELDIDEEKAPLARHYPGTIYDSDNKQIIIFGGTQRGLGGAVGNPISATWIFNFDNKKWRKVEAKKVPASRDGHSAVYDPLGKQMIIFGGSWGGNYFSDTWIFNIEKETWEKVIPNKQQL